MNLGFFGFFSLSCIPAFINQCLQHSHTQHEGDAELPTAHFNIELPEQGVPEEGVAGGTCCGLSQQFTLREEPCYHSEEFWQLAQSQAFHSRNVTRDFSSS